MKKVRIFLLRLLLGWWVIPLSWSAGFFLWWLMAGWEEAVDTGKVFSKIMWNGEPEC